MPQALTRDDCYRMVADSLFKLRPKDYSEKHPNWPGQVGIEVEMMGLKRERFGRKPEAICLFAGERPLADQLLALAKDKGLTPHFDDEGKLASLTVGEAGNITFEPGAQVEFSTTPYPCFTDADAKVKEVQGWLEELYRSNGYELLQLAINPWLTPAEIGLQMQKPRYRAMDAYFRQISSYGERMMRQTGTLQVNLDFGGDETTLAKRFLLANLLAPPATAMFANSPIADNKDTGAASFRSQCWQNLDHSRTGFPALAAISEKLSKESCVAAYFDFAMKAHVVFVPADGYANPNPSRPFSAWLEEPIGGFAPTREDFATHLSLLFPEARPKGFIEVRSVDCPFKVFQSVPSQFYASLLYSDAIMEKALTILLPSLSSIDSLWRASSFGLGRDPALAAMAGQLVELAFEGLSELPPCFISPKTRKSFKFFAEHLTLKGRSQADTLRQIYERSEIDYFSPEDILCQEALWQEQIDSSAG